MTWLLSLLDLKLFALLMIYFVLCDIRSLLRWQKDKSQGKV